MKRIVVLAFALAFVVPLYVLFNRIERERLRCAQVKSELYDKINKYTSQYSEDCYVATHNAPKCIMVTLSYNAYLRELGESEYRKQRCPDTF